MFVEVVYISNKYVADAIPPHFVFLTLCLGNNRGNRSHRKVSPLYYTVPDIAICG